MPTEHLTAEQVKALAVTTEAEFTRLVIQVAQIRGWRAYHADIGRGRSGRWLTPSQGDGRGWPDLFFVQAGRMVVAELKVGRNKPTAEQEAWLAAFRACGVPTYLWYPRDWDEIERVLGPEGGT